MKAMPRAACLAPLMLLLICSSTAHAQTFHLKEGDFEKGSIAFESINSYQDRFPVNAERTSTGHEAGFGYGLTSWWGVKALLALNKPHDEDLAPTRAIFENVLMLHRVPEGTPGISLGWFQAFEVAVREDETNATVFGPVIGLEAGKFSIATNSFFEKTFGQNYEDGISFVYGWQARYEIFRGVRVGVEGYGRIPDIGNSPGPDFQEHRIGPVILIETELASAKRSPTGRVPHTELELGVLFGLTEATPETTVKGNLHFKF